MHHTYAHACIRLKPINVFMMWNSPAQRLSPTEAALRQPLKLSCNPNIANSNLEFPRRCNDDLYIWCSDAPQIHANICGVGAQCNGTALMAAAVWFRSLTFRNQYLMRHTTARSKVWNHKDFLMSLKEVSYVHQGCILIKTEGSWTYYFVITGIYYILQYTKIHKVILNCKILQLQYYSFNCIFINKCSFGEHKRLKNLTGNVYWIFKSWEIEPLHDREWSKWAIQIIFIETHLSRVYSMAYIF